MVRMGKLKTNVIKKEWTVPVVRTKDGLVILMPIYAESYDAAKLLVGEEFRIDEDSPSEKRKVSEN